LDWLAQYEKDRAEHARSCKEMVGSVHSIKIGPKLIKEGLRPTVIDPG
jgi:hypothetical protein